MSKIEELIENEELEFDRYTNKTTVHKTEIVKLMKEYAEYYAKKCLERVDDEMGWDSGYEEWTCEFKASEFPLINHDEI